MMLQLQRRTVRSVDPLPASPPAHRGGRSRLKDPRLLAGVLLVVAAMATGALVLGTRSEGTPVVRAARDLPADIALDPADFEVTVVDLPSGSSYPSALPDGTVILAQPLRAGDFVPQQAFVTESGVDVRLVTVPVDSLHAPISLSPGARVDVWATPTTESAAPALVIRDALVAATTADAESATGQLGVVLEIPAGDAAAVVAATHTGMVDLVAVPQGGAR